MLKGVGAGVVKLAGVVNLAGVPVIGTNPLITGGSEPGTILGSG